jgi:4-hydroxy-3-methylbut-2-enyl diphosphate reductase
LRQNAAIELARSVEVVVVVGGAHSNNTRELAESCRKYCARVRQIETASELRGEWFEECETVGLTAGTSTPDDVITAVENRLSEIAREKRWAAVTVK